MLAQYLVSLGPTNLRKSKTKNVIVINSPQVNKERIFHVHLLMDSFVSCTKNTFHDKASGSALFLILSYFSNRYQACVLINCCFKKTTV